MTNLKALFLSSLLTSFLNILLNILLSVLLAGFFVALISKSQGGFFIFPLSMISLLPCQFFLFFVVIVVFGCVASFLYYKFNNSLISVGEGAIAGACYYITLTLLLSMGVGLLTMAVGITRFGGELFSSIPILLPLQCLQCICWSINLVISAASGAAVGALLSRQQKKPKYSSNEWEFEEEKTPKKDSWDEKW